MKAIIPVAGFGTRLKPFTLTNPKVLLNVAGKPMIYFVVDQLIKEKLVDEIIFVTGYLGDKFEHYIRKTFDYNYKFLIQEEPKGLGHAIHSAKPGFDKNEDALIILGDTLFDVNLKELTSTDKSVIAVKKVEDPRRFGVVETNQEGLITRFIEKPASKEVSPSNEAITGIYYLKNSDKLFEAIEHVINNEITVKGEYQLTDALEYMLSTQKEKMTTYPIEGWLDCGKPETMLETNRYFLTKMDKKYEFDGDVKIIHPVFIGENVKIENSIIGPYATINNNCHIKGSKIKDSIINSHTTIVDSILHESLVGEHCKIHNQSKKLYLGEFSEI